MIFRRLRRFLCRIGVDAACYHDDQELAERLARMRTLTWRLELLATEYLPDHRKRGEGGR